jgi:hypothetical protein
MDRAKHEAEMAAFISRKGVTRCPTAFVGQTQGAKIESADREHLSQRAEDLEAQRQLRSAHRRFGRG